MQKKSHNQKRKQKKLVKKLRKDRRKKREQKKLNRPKPWVPVKMDLVEMPRLFKDDVSVEERQKIIKEVGKQAKKDFNNKYPQIKKWFQDYDPIYILSFCAMYFVSSPEGIDKEALGKLDFPYHLLELLQAFALIKKRTASLKPLRENVEILQEEMREIGDLMMFRFLDVPDHLEDKEDLEAYRLRIRMMSQTTAVRNRAYHHQIKRTVLELSSLVDDDFEAHYGVKATIFFNLIFELGNERNNLLNNHLDKVRKFYRKGSYKKVVKAFNEAFPENTPIEGEEVERIWHIVGKNLKSLKWTMIAHSDLKLENIYAFDIQRAIDLIEEPIDKTSLKNLFDLLSFKFGDLRDQNIEHMILDNPVHHKPFIKLDSNRYYSSIWGVMSHFILDIFESLLSDVPKLRKKYYGKIKANYLEDKVEAIFRKGFPDAQIIRSTKWNGYENDLLVIIDTFAIVVEDKARLVSSYAKRGAPLDLPETLKRLIEEPSEQALRFVDYLKNQNGIIKLETEKGEDHDVDTDKIKYYIPLGVTFHHLGSIGSNLKNLINAKYVSKDLEHLAPSMSFTDLEVLFDLLPQQSLKVHYLARRREFEAHMLYEGDELDLLAFYFDNGFNIGEIEYSQNFGMNILAKSKELDPYVIGSNEGKEVVKPKLAMTEWWNDLLSLIETRKANNWLEITFTLLNTTIKDQEKFEKMFKDLAKKTILGELDDPHNWVVLLSGPERRRFAIIGYPYITKDRDLRNNMMGQALDDKEVRKAKGTIAIGVDILRKDYPYTVLASRMDTDLLDILTIDR